MPAEYYQQRTNVVLLDPDVAHAFKDSESVNRALRLLLDLAAALPKSSKKVGESARHFKGK